MKKTMLEQLKWSRMGQDGGEVQEVQEKNRSSPVTSVQKKFFSRYFDVSTLTWHKELEKSPPLHLWSHPHY